MAEGLIRQATANGDMTRADMVEISQSPDFSVDFQGLVREPDVAAGDDDAWSAQLDLRRQPA